MGQAKERNTRSLEDLHLIALMAVGSELIVSATLHEQRALSQEKGQKEDEIDLSAMLVGFSKGIPATWTSLFLSFCFQLARRWGPIPNQQTEVFLIGSDVRMAFDNISHEDVAPSLEARG